MDLDTLNVFSVVAKTQSIARAAEVLDMTTSSVSRKVKSLEDEFNTELFHRGGRQFSLTSQGALMLQRAELLLGEADNIRDLLSHDQHVIGPVRLMSPPSLASILAERFLPDFLRRYPDIEFSLKTNFGRRIETLYDYDIAISPNLPVDTSLVAKPLYRGRRYFYASPKLLEARGVPSDPDDLAEYPFLALFTDSSHHQGSFRWDNGRGQSGEFTTQVTFGSDLPDVLATMVSEGMGVACLPEGALRYQNSSDFVRLFDELTFDQNILYAIYPSRHYRPHRVKVFAEEVTRFIRSL
ncbi:LysR family transcriptional regulator [Ferrimonas aestuarii]|uniref:LysR family transcriptional regulator n=1 Tax=Ferrimonas aestuarii TaxID=2569539 RepID=A0A4U1BQB7_9GAMM|nr:LysR family transcriptional regulator [Ferrimonas aestuarii]TKB56512.1 LysR family transcriptional regulator [Ferrimonas aestuarii]